MPVQYGGGLRSLPAVRDALRAGAERVIIGTAAFRDVDFLDSVIEAFGPRVLVSVDVRGGHISTAGWTQTTQMPAGDAIRRLGDRGVTSFVYTDVDRDGKLEGPDLDDVRAVAEAVRGRFLYSGGIGSLEHLSALAGLRQVNLAGVIVGKALYEQRFTVAEGQAALDSARAADGYSRCAARPPPALMRLREWVGRALWTDKRLTARLAARDAGRHMPLSLPVRLLHIAAVAVMLAVVDWSLKTWATDRPAPDQVVLNTERPWQPDPRLRGPSAPGSSRSRARRCSRSAPAW